MPPPRASRRSTPRRRWLPVRRSFPARGLLHSRRRFETPEEVRIVADAGALGYLSIAAHGHADALGIHADCRRQALPRRLRYVRVPRRARLAHTTSAAPPRITPSWWTARISRYSPVPSSGCSMPRRRWTSSSARRACSSWSRIMTAIGVCQIRCSSPAELALRDRGRDARVCDELLCSGDARRGDLLAFRAGVSGRHVRIAASWRSATGCAWSSSLPILWRSTSCAAAIRAGAASAR